MSEAWFGIRVLGNASDMANKKFLKSPLRLFWRNGCHTVVAAGHSKTMSVAFFMSKMSKFLEIDIENYIWELVKNARFETNKISLERGVYYRQYKIAGVGIIDMLSIKIERYRYDNGGLKNVIKIRVFELKRDAINCDNVGQISRYIDHIRSHQFSLLKIMGFGEKYEIEVEGILIGRGIQNDAMHILSLLYPTVFVWTFDFCLEKGISFKQQHLFEFSHNHRKKIGLTPGMIMPSLRGLKACGAIESFDYRTFDHSLNQE